MLESAFGIAMNYYYPLLLYLGSGGALLLLAISAIPRLRVLRSPVSTLWVMTMALVWVLSPASGRWVLSVWSPDRVSSGLLVLDVHPALWWCVLLILVAATGIMWFSGSERRSDMPLTGMLFVVMLTVGWLGLTSGSLLMTLTMWAMFDVVWFMVRLLSRADGERVIWATAINGIASLTLWAASLLLLRSGDTGLWWLMRPPASVLTLLYVAALIRTGFYPFQIGHVAASRAPYPLALMSVMGSVMGVALLYRLVALPGAESVPGWVVGWGCVSVLWAGIKALGAQGRQAALSASFGILLAAVTGGLAAQRSDLLVVAVGVWTAASALVIVYRPRHGAGFLMALPTLFAVSMLLGAPPSPLLGLYTSVLSGQTGIVGRVLYAMGLALIAASLLRGTMRLSVGRDRVTAIRLRACQIGGSLLIVVVLVAASLRVGVAPAMSLSMVLWLGVILVGAALARWGEAGIRQSWGRSRPWIELLDLTWFYRAVWQGAQNALGVARVTAEVVEGSGSVLWSVLILLLALMVVGGR